MFQENYDIIVVGGGHAGCEAAAAAANLGCKILLITMNLNTIGQMSCNPAMGGVAKGQIIREIDALGGYSGIVTDNTMIQFRMLNKSKGPAMWSPRSQNDKFEFAKYWKYMLEQTYNIDFWQDMVVDLVVKKTKLQEVRTQMGLIVKSKCVILTNGTFLNGKIHVGEKNFGGGRSGEKSSIGLTEKLTKLGFKSGRMKTGTPPRIDGRSINYNKVEEQKGDDDPGRFSFLKTPKLTNQKSCYITYTNSKTHEILKKSFDKSPMFSGNIAGAGPRYCPSIEDKITRFKEKNQHQIFIEPEGKNTYEIYVNGFSTSLPELAQYEGLKSIMGFENVKMIKPGYAIEYDYFPPTQLKYNLETKIIENLFFAGQINGTTGYEEAAAQGLLAGINANQKIQKKEDFILKRSEAYIGVLIDDLINKGTEEPYRMFTSRAEFRILLRQENADERLTKKSKKIGLASEERIVLLKRKTENKNKVFSFCQKTSIKPKEINPILVLKNKSEIKQSKKLKTILSRPEISFEEIIKINHVKSFFENFEEKSIKEAITEIKYEGYIKKEKENVEKIKKLESLVIPKKINYKKIKSLSSEAIEKLTATKPDNIGQASRISGVSPSDINILLISIGR